MIKIARWNFERNNTNFDPELEMRMLTEEALEFKDGLNDYFNALENNEDPMDSIVDMIDAWADYQFVMQGSTYKYLGSARVFPWDSIRIQEEFMYRVLTKDLKITEGTLDICLKAVISANEAKGKTKVNGKIQKGPDWIDPKQRIFEILMEEGGY